MELIKTIEEDEEVNYESDTSKEDQDEDLRAPKKKKKKLDVKKKVSDEFADDFSFFSNQKEYVADTWSDMSAYIKASKRAKSTLSEKIAKVRKERAAENEDIGSAGESENEVEEDSSSDSDSEEWDDVKVKGQEKSKKKRKKPSDDDEENGNKHKGTVKIENPDNKDAEDEYFEFDESATFRSLLDIGSSKPILKAIEDLKWAHPTPIQAATIPTAVSGKDICGCAATGTGKTAAYMLPILARLWKLEKTMAESVTRVLVMVPTRELGVQVFQVNFYGNYLTFNSLMINIEKKPNFINSLCFFPPSAYYFDLDYKLYKSYI